MSKFSEFPRATALSMDDLILISRLVSEGKYSSEAAPLSLIANLLGGIRVVDVGVNLNDLDEQGIYILQGAETFQASYNLGYPFGLQPGSKVMMIISAEGGDYMGTITQHYFHSKTNTPFPQSRYKSAAAGSSYSAWDQPISGTVFDQKGVQQLNMSTYGIELQSCYTGAASAYYSFPAVGPASAPNPKTSPTLKKGVHHSIKDPKAGYYEGAYRGNVMIVDEDNRMFLNVDKTFTSDADNPKGVNWKEMLGVYIKDLQSLSMVDESDAYGLFYTMNKMITLLRDIKAIGPNDNVVTEVKRVANDPELQIGAGFGNVNMEIQPPDGRGTLYIKSSDESVVSLADNAGNLLQGTVERNDMRTSKTTASDGSSYWNAIMSIGARGLKAGSCNILIATDANFTNVVGTIPITLA